MARSMISGSAMSLGVYSENLEWNRIFGVAEFFFHTRPMCTASVLCIGMSGETSPQCDGSPTVSQGEPPPWAEAGPAEMRPATPKTKADLTASFAKRPWLPFIGVLPSDHFVLQGRLGPTREGRVGGDSLVGLTLFSAIVVAVGAEAAANLPCR